MSEQDIRELIKNRRKELGLSLDEVAEKIGVTKATVHRWETGVIGNMGIDKANLLADVLKLDPLLFLGRKPKQIKESEKERKARERQEMIKNYKLDDYEQGEYDKIMEMNFLLFEGRKLTNDEKEELEEAIKDVFVSSILRRRKRLKIER